jgi:hypothetical protein
LRRIAATQAQTVTQTVVYSDQDTINGTAYDPAAPPMFYAQSGTVQQWTIVNNSAQVHTFHIHQIHFAVEAYDGIKLSQQYEVDNVNVPAATATGPGTVQLLLDFTDPLVIGTFLLHCHILSHEDAGMMAKIRVGTAPPLSASPTSVTFANPSAAAQSVAVSGGLAPYSASGCGTVVGATVNGSSITLKPVAAGSCLLTIADSSGLIVSVPITVNSPASPIVVSPSSLSFTSPSAASENASLSGGTPPYTASGCSGIAASAVSGPTLTVAPLAPGSCSLTVSDSAGNSSGVAVSVNQASTGSPMDNLTFHQNAMRQGWYSSEKQLTTTSVASGNFGLLTTLTAPAGQTAMGKVYSQPLYVSNQLASDGNLHNLVIVSTATDQVYAYDDQTLTEVWHRDFTNSAAGVTPQSWSDTGCSDVNPYVGITGTPVIDRSLNELFVVVATKENGVFYQRLHGISLASGADVAVTNITASESLATGGTASFNPEWNFNRAALLEANGNIYAAFGSHCDYDSTTTHGWVLSYAASTLAPTGSVANITDANLTTTAYYLGAPWMSGFGPAADAQGNIYFATGNGPWNGTTDFSMSALKLPGNLNVGDASYFTPAGEAADSSGDADFGAGGVVLLPDQAGSLPHLMLAGGKCGVGTAKGGTQGCQKYLLNRDNLGGQHSGDAGALWHADTGGTMFGGPAYFQGPGGAQYVLYGGNPLNAYALSLSPPSLTVYSSTNSAVGCLECRNGGSQPVVSSNGTLAGSAVAWAIKDPSSAGGTVSLYAFDAVNLSKTLFTGVAGQWTKTPGASWIAGLLSSPLVANGRVYVPTDGGVAVFGLSGTATARPALRRQRQL